MDDLIKLQYQLTQGRVESALEIQLKFLAESKQTLHDFLQYAQE